jgi:hypothetical protein
VCSNALRRDRCVVADNHVTYLASFGPGIVKIGVARWNRRVERLAEQGARAAIILARDDGQQVRRLETFVKRHIKVRQLTRDGLKDALIPDRLAPTTKLWAYTKRAVAQMDGESDEAHHARETEMLLQELERIASHEIRPRFDAKWTGEKDMVDLPRFALPAREPRLMSLRPHDRVRGTITSICGETIILNSDTGETVAMDAGSLVGYPLRSLTDSEHGEGQLSMSLF